MNLQSFWKAVVVKKPSAASVGADEAILSKGSPKLMSEQTLIDNDIAAVEAEWDDDTTTGGISADRTVAEDAKVQGLGQERTALFEGHRVPADATALFTPVTIPTRSGSGLTLRNRVVLAPMCQYAGSHRPLFS